MRHAPFVATICLLALLAVPGASAQSPDRDSPSGQEYRIPIDYTRCEYSRDGCDKRGGARGSGAGGGDSDDGKAGGGSAGGTAGGGSDGGTAGGGSGDSGLGGPSGGGSTADPGSRGSSTLFGAGITQAPNGAKGPADSGPRSGGESDRLPDAVSASGKPVSPGLGTVDAVEASEAGLSTSTAAVALAVLAAGGLLGLGLRRFSRSKTGPSSAG